MICAAGVEGRGARGARISASEVLIDQQLIPARATEDRLLSEFIPRPDGWFVIRKRSMAIEARIPAAAAFEFDGDDIQWRVPVGASCFRINVDPVNLASVDNLHE